MFFSGVRGMICLNTCYGVAMNAAPIHRRALIARSLGMGLVLVAGTAFASDLPAAVAVKARAVVQAQLDAFAADDARRAFLLASPSARKHLGSPDNFIHLGRERYLTLLMPPFSPPWGARRIIRRAPFFRAVVHRSFST